MDNEEYAEVIMSKYTSRPTQKTVDTFDMSAEDAKNLGGVSPAFKRHITRKFLQGRDGAKTKQQERSIETSYDVFEVATPPYNQIYLSKLYELSSYHHAAVDAKVANVVGLGYDFVESHKTKTKLDSTKGKEATDKIRNKLSRMRQNMIELFDTFNEEELFIQTLEKVITDLEVTGNGYLEIGRTTGGQIGYIGHIPAAHMRVRLDRDGFVQIVGNKFTFFRNYQDTVTSDPIGRDSSPNEVIHFKKYSPGNSYYGVPDIVSAKEAVAGNEFAQRYNLDYFEHKAVPRYMIVLKGAKLDEANEQRLLEFFETNLKGQNHRSVYVPLPADDPTRKVELEVKPIENNVQESSFIRYQDSNRDEILMAHRVPISKIGMANGVSLAMARDADKTFKEQVCGPQQRTIQKKINKIVREFTDALDFKLNELTLTDEDTQSRIDERYLRMQVITPNEVRARKGEPGIKGGDTPVQLNAKASAEQNAQARESRQRDQERQANAPDQTGEARQPKGEGRAQQ